MSVKFTDNSAAVKAQFEKNIAKTLVQMGLHWQRRATDEANRMIYETPESPTYKRTNRYKASLSFITPDFNSGKNPAASSDESRPSDVLHGQAPKDTAVVGSNVEYAPDIEMGTSRMAARPVVGNAVLNYQDEYREIITKTMKEGF